MICKNCEHDNEKNAKFCNKCGKNLKTGENNNLNNIVGIAKSTTEDILNMFKKPIDTCKSFIKEENFFKALLYIGINVLFMALFVLLLVRYFHKSMLSINDIGLGISLNIPYFKIFMLTIISTLIVYMLLAGIPYLINTYLLKGKTTFKQIITWIGINSLITLVFSIVTMFILLISAKLAIIISLVGFIIYTYNLFKSFSYTTDVSDNKLVYVITATMMLTIFIVAFVLPELL